MVNVIDELNEFVNSSTHDESISAILRKAIPEQLKEMSSPYDDYFFITHLCNPSCFYLSILHPEIKKSSEILRKLLRGKQLHQRAIHWFRHLEGFLIYEGKIDGIWTGLKGVRGQIDFLVGDSILELKTKDSLPKNEEEVIKLFPHDVEQLAFYSAIHPSNPKVNYLIFMESNPPQKFLAFKMIVKDLSRIKSLVNNRISKLRKAIENRDSSGLGKCRYHGLGCQYCEEKLCNCDTVEDLSTEQLEKSMELSYDKEFTEKLEESRRKGGFSGMIFTTKDVIAPRQHYKEHVEGITSSWIPDSGKEEFWLCLRSLIEKLPIELSLHEKKQIHHSLVEPRLGIGFRWAKIKSSQKGGELIVPYLIKVGGQKDVRYTFEPNEYHLAELAIITPIYEKTRGLIFMIYPKLNNLIKVFDIKYNKPQEIRQKVKQILDDLEKAEKDKDPSILPETPGFMLKN